jgi:hypothetical protein
MHEQALVRDLRRKIDELARAHGDVPIVRARVAIGALSHLDEPRLRTLWTEAMAGGPGANAALEVEPIASPTDPLATSVVLRSVTFADRAAERRTDGPATGPPSPSSSSDA